MKQAEQCRKHRLGDVHEQLPGDQQSSHRHHAFVWSAHSAGERTRILQCRAT